MPLLRLHLAGGRGGRGSCGSCRDPHRLSDRTSGRATAAVRLDSAAKREAFDVRLPIMRRGMIEHVHNMICHGQTFGGTFGN